LASQGLALVKNGFSFRVLLIYDFLAFFHDCFTDFHRPF
jgi:hypothetical protein